ncbi:MAG: dTMP kinase [Rhodospirillaceae bacterium]|nr:dTMP kinase [Rhodospirillaceae bacterium]
MGPVVAQGFFITFEGGEGGGKSTQTKLLAEALKAKGYDVVLTREPGGAPGAEAIRALLVQGDVSRWDGVTEILLHYAARRDHVAKTVWPAMAAGKVVISDRHADSTMAYQGYGHGIDKAVVREIHHATLGDFKPNLTLILDLSIDAGLKRAMARPDMAKSTAEDRYERMGHEFHERLRQGFLEIAKAEPQRCKVIDAARSIEAIQVDILSATLTALDKATQGKISG